MGRQNREDIRPVLTVRRESIENGRSARGGLDASRHLSQPGRTRI